MGYKLADATGEDSLRKELRAAISGDRLRRRPVPCPRDRRVGAAHAAREEEPLDVGRAARDVRVEAAAHGAPTTSAIYKRRRDASRAWWVRCRRTLPSVRSSSDFLLFSICKRLRRSPLFLPSTDATCPALRGRERFSRAKLYPNTPNLPTGCAPSRRDLFRVLERIHGLAHPARRRRPRKARNSTSS